MIFNWREHGAAFEEFREAARWYDRQRPGLGDAFIDAVDAAIESILDPHIGWSLYRGHRGTPPIYTRSVPGFPYKIVFVETACDVLVIAYAHERRRPGYWKSRVPRQA